MIPRKTLARLAWLEDLGWGVGGGKGREDGLSQGWAGQV